MFQLSAPKFQLSLSEELGVIGIVSTIEGMFSGKNIFVNSEFLASTQEYFDIPLNAML